MKPKHPEDWLERHLVAAALAEEGLHDDALRACGLARDEGDALDAWLAAHGVRMHCAVLSPAALAVRR
jgi:hypothetical protein